MAKSVKVAFVGSRGIPARYGGAETFVEKISQRLTGAGFEVYVSCNSNRFGKDVYNGVIRIHTPAIQGRTLTVPTINEILAVFHLLLRCPGVNAIYYATSYAAPAALATRLLGKKVIINTDGIEWRRPVQRRPYLSPIWKLVSVLVARYLMMMERLAVKVADVIIADSRAIKEYLEQRYGAKNAVFIPYGARELGGKGTLVERDREILQSLALSLGEYYLTVGRIVAENNMHVEIEGFKRSTSNKRLVIVGNFNDRDRYSRYLSDLKGSSSAIVFMAPVYDEQKLSTLRKNCFAYVHAYELGGTNPSLLEQMLFGRPILAHDVAFNREVLEAGSIYFRGADDLAECITKLEGGEYDVEKMGERQLRRVDEEYNWDNVAARYETLFKQLLSR